MIAILIGGFSPFDGAIKSEKCCQLLSILDCSLIPIEIPIDLEIKTQVVFEIVLAINTDIVKVELMIDEVAGEGLR